MIVTVQGTSATIHRKTTRTTTRTGALLIATRGRRNHEGRQAGPAGNANGWTAYPDRAGRGHGHCRAARNGVISATTRQIPKNSSIFAAKRASLESKISARRRL